MEILLPFLLNLSLLEEMKWLLLISISNLEKLPLMKESLLLLTRLKLDLESLESSGALIIGILMSLLISLLSEVKLE